MLEIYRCYPLHIGFAGPIEFDQISILVKDLSGVYLDYSVALSAIEDGVLSFDFLPDGYLYQVRHGTTFSDLGLYSPSKNDDVEELRNIVKEKFGDSIEVPKIKR